MVQEITPQTKSAILPAPLSGEPFLAVAFKERWHTQCDGEVTPSVSVADISLGEGDKILSLTFNNRQLGFLTEGVKLGGIKPAVLSLL